MTIILETERLILRHLIPEDLDALWALYSDPEVTRHIPDAPRSREEAREELEWHRHGHPKNRALGLWATIHKETGQFIGRCGLIPWTLDGQAEVEVAYTLARTHWGQGLGTEAAQAAQAILNYGSERLGLTRLVCLIEPGNIASMRVAEKIGMALEKEMRDEIARLPAIAKAYVSDPSTQAVLAVTWKASIDLLGFWGYGAIGWWILFVSITDLPETSYPKLLAILGIVVAIPHLLIPFGAYSKIQAILTRGGARRASRAKAAGR